MDLLKESELTTHCPFKGDASYWTVRVGNKVVENAVWSYPEPTLSAGSPTRRLPGLLLAYDGRVVVV